jgi:hypothetical protein
MIKILQVLDIELDFNFVNKIILLSLQRFKVSSYLNPDDTKITGFFCVNK